MKSLAAADRYGYPRYVANQTYYSLIGRDYEWELMPLGLDQGLGAVVWSPLGWGRLTGKLRRGQPLPKQSRLHDTRAMTARRSMTSISIASSMRSMRSRKDTGKEHSADRAELAAATADACRPSSSAPATRNSCSRISARSAGH